MERIWRFALRETASVLAKVMSFVTFAALFLLLTLDGSRVAIPWFDQVFKVVAGPRAQDIAVGDVEFVLGQGDIPAGLYLNDVVIQSGEVSVVLPRVETQFTMLNGIQGLVRPKSIEVSGTRLNFIRTRQNQFAILSAVGAPIVLLGPDAGSRGDADLASVIGGLADMEKLAVLEELDVVTLDRISVAFSDQRNGRHWISRDAKAEIRRENGQLLATLDATLDARNASRNDAAPMKVSIRMNGDLQTGRTEVSARFADVPPADLASQVGLLEWMDVIEGRVTGHLSLNYNDAATLTQLSGVLELGPGKIEPEPGQTIGFDGAKGYFRYDPNRDVIGVDGLTVDTSFGALAASGQVTPKRDEAGSIAALVGQMAVSHLDLDAPGYLARPLVFTAGTVTSRIAFDPFRIDIGQAQLFNEDSRISLSGRVRPGAEAWDIALDGQVDDIAMDDAMALWPARFRPNLRNWLTNHIYDGRVTNLAAHLRTVDGRPDIGLDFAFSEGQGRILDTMPQVQGGTGRGTLVGDRLSIAMRAGHAEIDGARIDLAGSRFVVPDTRIDAAPAIAVVRARGPIPALLAAINLPPLGLMDRFGRQTDLATGQAVVSAELGFDLRKDLRAADVLASVDARLQDFASDVLVAGRHLAADDLHLVADNQGMRIAGAATLSQVPLRFTYAQDFGAGAAPGRIDGSLPVTAENLARLGIDLPDGTLGGTGSARFKVSLRGDQPPRYDVTAGLGGNTLSVPELGWTKPAGPAARVALSGTLSAPATVEALDFSGPGLAARGRLELSQTGLRRATFTRLAVGGWLDAPLDWVPPSNRATVSGGTIDLRKGPDFKAQGSTGVALDLKPERVIVSDGIVLTGFRGDITTKGGTRGRFRARVNGKAEVAGVIQAGSAIYIEGRDGGAVLRDAGLFANAQGGTLRVSLKPLASGVYDGRFSLQKTRVTGAPVLAEMLSFISVFGLIDRLGGQGIAFEDVQGWFTLSGNRLVISRSRAVGKSMGVTLAGSYRLDTDRLDMEGVLSPLYFVNGLPGRIFGLGRFLGGRDGEGLLGANFTIAGTAGDPRTSVNPLSVLTPGATREIFQTRPNLQPAAN